MSTELELKLSELSLALGHQDVIRLAGLVFLRRGFVEEADEKGLDAVFAQEGAYGDLTDEQKATFRAAFQEPELRAIVKQWWEAYDRARVDGRIPQAGVFWQ